VSCFLYSLASKTIKCRGYHITGDRVERKEVHKAQIESLLVLACLVHQYSEIRDLISCPPSLSESRLFVCNFRFGLHSSLGSFQYDSTKNLACMGDKSNCSVICTLFKITFSGSGMNVETSIPLVIHQFPRSPHIFCAFCPVLSLLLI